ncbi:GNAT family N-acetyltransferase [Thiotrichales bacterium 19S3-7]|nr:GNAT family N-acetyltransferase [Thiotrichales bacterium 19S3-7]MCF6802007.1 GNAT family N-acetyltransferase [Thiotrichales bacterium 19S3-11]
MKPFHYQFNDQIYIASLDQADPLAVLDFFKRTDQLFYELTPERSEHFYTEQYWHFEVEMAIHHFEKQKKASFVIAYKDDNDKEIVVGWVNYNNVIHGAFKACYLGYVLDEPFHGKNIMYTALSVTIPYVMDAFHLNRIMANYIPENKPSERVLLRLGFEKEGYAKRYLKLGGKWRDHVMTAFINRGVLK